MRTSKGKEVCRYRPRCEVDPKAEADLRASFGKAAIITDLAAADLADEELLKASVARWEIEEEFRWLKDRLVISIKPVWVWNDAAVPGHVFLCVMGLMLLRYLQWEARDPQLSVKELTERLGKIRVAVVSRGGVPGQGGQPGMGARGDGDGGGATGLAVQVAGRDARGHVDPDPDGSYSATRFSR